MGGGGCWKGVELRGRRGVSKDGMRVGCGCAKYSEGMGGVVVVAVCHVGNEKVDMISNVPRFGC